MESDEEFLDRLDHAAWQAHEAIARWHQSSLAELRRPTRWSWQGTPSATEPSVQADHLLGRSGPCGGNLRW